MIQWPALLGGKNKLVAWLNKLLRAGRSSELKKVVGPGHLIENTDGKTLVILPTPPVGVSYQFRIYQGSTWLKMKVATGDLITTGDAFEPSNPDTELTLTSGVAKFYIYLSFSSATAASFIATATAPTWDVNKVPIGWVDTTDTTNSRSVIHQLQREYIYNPCL